MWAVGGGPGRVWEMERDNALWAGQNNRAARRRWALCRLEGAGSGGGAPVPSGGRRQAGRSKEAGHAVGRDQRCNDWVPIFPCKAQLWCS